MSRSRRKANEGGQILIMIIGFGLAILLLITFVVDASQVFLYQRSLHGVADGAALEASNAVDTGSIYEDGSKGEFRLSWSLAEQRVQEYAAKATQPRDFECHVPRESFEATRVTVRCDGKATLPFVNTFTAGYGGVVDVPVEASAETFAN